MSSNYVFNRGLRENEADAIAGRAGAREAEDYLPGEAEAGEVRQVRLRVELS